MLIFIVISMDKFNMNVTTEWKLYYFTVSIIVKVQEMKMDGHGWMEIW